MKKLFACALLGVAFLWAPSAFACDYGVVQIRRVVEYPVQEIRKVQRVVEEEVEVRRIEEIREVREVRKAVEVRQINQPAVKVQVKNGIFGLRRTNITIR